MRVEFFLSKSRDTVAVEVVNDTDGNILIKTVTRAGTAGLPLEQAVKCASSEDERGTLTLSKSEARAIASAMMGCAAEA